jgi:Fur family transcriptional regulator, ferric uptake regulator
VKGSSVQQLQDRLRTVGLRATLPRVAVLRHLMSVRSPLSHGDVAEALEASGFDRATVYRNLMDLTDAGMLRRSDMGDHVWRFELVNEAGQHEGEEHPHFICGGCGAVECLPEGSVSVRPVRGSPRALRRKGIAVQVRGLCNGCL